MKNCWHFDSPIGLLTIAEDGIGITDLFLRKNQIFKGFQEKRTPLLQEAQRQLGAYFAGKLREFQLSLSLHGTNFQLADWAALQTIPYGETRSYGQIAAQLGKPEACRAVGGANGRNPAMIFVPCHRVICADGSLGGFSSGEEIKRFLLELEKAHRSSE